METLQIYCTVNYLGRQYNEQGSIEDWWTEESLQRYKLKTKCFKDTYGNYNTVENGNHEEASSIRF